MSDSASVCQAIPDVNVSTIYPTASTFYGQVVLCGGNTDPRDCLIYNPETLSRDTFATLMQNRVNHATVQLSDNSFWLTGKKGH